MLPDFKQTARQLVPGQPPPRHMPEKRRPALRLLSSGEPLKQPAWPEKISLVPTQGAGVSKHAAMNHAFQIMSATVLPAGMNGMTCVL